jgi:hypothetical protein
MAEDNNQAPKSSGASKEEVALELMRFIAQTTGVGRGGTGAGFAGKAAKTPEEQVDVLLALYDKCRSAVNK